VAFHQGDLFAALGPEFKGAFDLVVVNPPYIDPAARETLAPEVRDHEPREALFADEHGLAVIKNILAGAGEWLKPGGWLGLEFGTEQAAEVKILAAAAGIFGNLEIRPDDAHIPRFLFAQKR
jgi:release factor glutamine methyltransferase